MINSESYIIAEEHLLSFVGKMNFDGDVSDIDTETKMFSWISANLTRTDFSSFSEAQTEWENVKYLGLISFEENIGFYEVIGGRGNELVELIVVHNPLVVQPMSGCPQACHNNFMSCSSSATTGFANDIDETMTAYQNHQISGDETSRRIQFAQNMFTIASQICSSSMIDCCLGGNG